MRTTTVQLLNGCTDSSGIEIDEAEIRELDGNDEDMLRDKDELKQDGIQERLLLRCIQRLGPYSDPERIRGIFFEHLHMADSIQLLIELRQWGIGPKYGFDVQCPKCEQFGRNNIDLSKLERKPIGKEFRYLKELTAKTPGDDGVTVKFAPLLVRHRAVLAQVSTSYKKERGTRELLIQVKELDGKSVNPEMLKALPWRVRNSIRELIDERSGGVNNELVMECLKCGTFKENMPFQLQSFFFQTEELSETLMARPFLGSGTTPYSSQNGSTGAPTTSASSPSESASSTSGSTNPS